MNGLFQFFRTQQQLLWMDAQIRALDYHLGVSREIELARAIQKDSENRARHEVGMYLDRVGRSEGLSMTSDGIRKFVEIDEVHQCVVAEIPAPVSDVYLDCACSSWCRAYPQPMTDKHHMNCPKYNDTIKVVKITLEGHGSYCDADIAGALQALADGVGNTATRLRLWTC